MLIQAILMMKANNYNKHCLISLCRRRHRRKYYGKFIVFSIDAIISTEIVESLTDKIFFLTIIKNDPHYLLE